MVDRFYGYQYDTNPRKLSPENTQIRNRYSRNGNQDSNDYESKPRATRRKREQIIEEEEETYLFETSKRRQELKQKSQSNNNNVRSDNSAKMKSKMDVNRDNEVAKVSKSNIKPKLKIVMLLIAGFSVLFAISYQNSLISESFNKKEQYKKEVEALSKTNQQMEVNIENSLNLNNIEQVAKEKIGMQKLSNNQKIYVKLPKQDYVAPAAEQVIIEEDTGLWGRIVKGFTKVLN